MCVGGGAVCVAGGKPGACPTPGPAVGPATAATSDTLPLIATACPGLLPAGFLGVLGGTFDPSLMCVMGGALLVALPTFQLALRRARPLCASCFELPRKTALDANLILGALTFGAGWGECRGTGAGRWPAKIGACVTSSLCACVAHAPAIDAMCMLPSPLLPAAGLGGICPGPALVALASLQPKLLLFVAAMLAGMRLDKSLEEVVCAVKKTT